MTPSVLPPLPSQVRAHAYKSWIGYHIHHMQRLGWSPAQIVAACNAYFGFQVGRSANVAPPAITEQQCHNMGISKTTPGLVVIKRVAQEVIRSSYPLRSRP